MGMDEFTDIPSVDKKKVYQSALDMLAADDGPAEVIEAIERIIKAADPEANTHVNALRALQIMRDMRQKTAHASTPWNMRPRPTMH